VVARDLDLEHQGAIGEMLDLLRLLSGVVAEPVGDANVASGDGDVHVDLLSRQRVACRSGE